MITFCFLLLLEELDTSSSVFGHGLAPFSDSTTIMTLDRRTQPYHKSDDTKMLTLRLSSRAWFISDRLYSNVFTAKSAARIRARGA